MNIKRIYKDLPIKNKMLLVFYIQIFITVIFIGGLFYNKIDRVMEEHAIDLSQDTLKIIETRTSDFTDNVEAISQDLLYDQEIYDVLLDDRSDKYLYYYSVSNLKNILRKRTLAFDMIQSITIVTRGREFLSYDTNGGRHNIEALIPYDYILPLARKADGDVLWFIDEVGDEKNVFLARIINDRDTYSEIGLMAILINTEELRSTYHELSSDILKNIAIISKDNNIIFNSNIESNSWLNNSDFNYNDNSGFIRDDDNNLIISYLKLEISDWYIVTGFYHDELTRDFSSLQRWMITIFIPAILLLSMLTIMLSMDIVTPMNQIVSRMESFKKGKRAEKPNLNRGDELGFLADNFEEMIDKVDYYMNNVLKEQILRKEVQIKALQSQINPHFLFNTLESINWRAQLIDAPDISEMVTALSSIIEVNISKDIKLIPLREDLEYVKNYLVIMSRRYEERLKIKWEINEDVLNINVPQLLLQPIVENSIKHGVGKTIKIGYILIKAYRDKDNVFIEVIDNGAGQPLDKVKALNEKFSKTTSTREYTMENEDCGIGLDNVNQRIKLLFGEKYYIRLESKENHYTRVIIKLPIE